MADSMSESYQWLVLCLNHTNESVIGMIQKYYQWLVSFRYTISHLYDSDIPSVIGMLQTYYQSLVDNMSESYQWLILCLNHTNDWWYTWIMPMTDNIPESYHWLIWYDSDILSVIGMIQVYYQSLVWFRHTIGHWYDSDILSVIGMIQVSNDWYCV
jgi:hypothetical protein